MGFKKQNREVDEMRKSEVAIICLIVLITVITIACCVGITILIAESDLPLWAKFILLK